MAQLSEEGIKVTPSGETDEVQSLKLHQFPAMILPDCQTRQRR